MASHLDEIQLDTGCISGFKTSQNGQVIHTYRGIPYAAPPVGDLRWKPPQPAAARIAAACPLFLCPWLCLRR